MTKGLTKRQMQVLEFIDGFVGDHGYPPTVREVAARFGFRSPRAAHDHMKALQRKGYLKAEPGKPRALEVLRPKGIPVLGTIAAGQPILAVEEAEQLLGLDPGFFGHGSFFALKVRGDSMVGDHIREGDMVIMRSQEKAEPGEVVAVMVEDEVTLKHFHPTAEGVELRPANPAMRPIRISGDQAPAILGVMRGLIRKT